MRVRINGFTLKMIAIVTMLVDHIGAGLFPDIIWLRAVGRLAFPIFAFFIAEGYAHTRSVKRYAVRLGVFAAVSEIPYNMLHSYRIFDPDSQNIFFTLLIGLLAIYGIGRLENMGGADYKLKTGTGADGKLPKMPFADVRPLKLAVICVSMAAAHFLRVDYGMFGVALIIGLHALRKNRPASLIFLAAANVFYGLFNLIEGYLPLQSLAALSAVPLGLYDGTRGPRLKYAFYAFYPLHIFVIMLIKLLIFKMPLN